MTIEKEGSKYYKIIHAWNAISIGRITAITTGGFHAWRKGEVI